jgi:hypothetical protein
VKKQDSGSRFPGIKNMRLRLIVLPVLALSLLIAGSAGSILGNTASAANTLTVNGYSQDGNTLHMWMTIQQQNGATVKAGLTPLTFAGVTGSTYTVVASNYDAGGIHFDRWGNGSTNKARSVTLGSNVWFDAFYRTGAAISTASTPSPSTYKLTVKSVDLNGNAITGYYTSIASATNGATDRTGFTPLSFTASAGTSYAVTPGDYNGIVFDHWENKSTARTRNVPLNSDTTITAYYRGGQTSSTSQQPTATTTSSYSPVTGRMLCCQRPGSSSRCTCILAVQAPHNGKK